jgi:dihydropteroate synthase
MSSMFWQTARYRIELDEPKVMGIVNVTPDSFSDGGQHLHAANALAHCERLLAEGAHILDIGGESSRPGAATLPAGEELRRVLSVVRGAVRLGVPISVDTCRSEVMQAVLDAGADIVNDIRALQLPGAVDVLVRHPGAGVCLMHMRGEPQTMQAEAHYDDVVREVGAFLRERCAVLQRAGIADERVVVDPGIGFAKTVEHNLELLVRQSELLAIGRPLLVGWSRKSTLGRLTDRPTRERGAASLAAALAAVQRGARIVRVHDVAETVDALKVWQAAKLVPSLPGISSMHPR